MEISNALQTVVETPRFLRDAEKAGVTEDERKWIVDVVAADPGQGDEVKGSGGVRKVRVAGRGKGKRGGYRVMVAFIDVTMPAYLLAVLSKGDRANFSAAEIEAMHIATAAIKRIWRNRGRA